MTDAQRLIREAQEEANRILKEEELKRVRILGSSWLIVHDYWNMNAITVNLDAIQTIHPGEDCSYIYFSEETDALRVKEEYGDINAALALNFRR